MKAIKAEEFNARYPIGTPVRYFPILGATECVDTKTRSEAWALGHGEVVVKVEGHAGGIVLRNLEILETPPVPSN